MTTRAYPLEGGVWVIAPEGRVDLPLARSIEETAAYLLDEGHTRLVIDLSAVTYMASAGLKALLTSMRRAQSLRGDLKIAALQQRVLEIFEMAGLDQIFTVYGTVAEAVQAHNLT